MRQTILLHDCLSVHWYISRQLQLNTNWLKQQQYTSLCVDVNTYTCSSTFHTSRQKNMLIQHNIKPNPLANTPMSKYSVSDDVLPTPAMFIAAMVKLTNAQNPSMTFLVANISFLDIVSLWKVVVVWSFSVTVWRNTSYPSIGTPRSVYGADHSNFKMLLVRFVTRKSLTSSTRPAVHG